MPRGSRERKGRRGEDRPRDKRGDDDVVIQAKNDDRKNEDRRRRRSSSPGERRRLSDSDTGGVTSYSNSYDEEYEKRTKG